MQKNILWQGIAYQSLENCTAETTTDGFEISSVIVGKQEDTIYKVEYTIQTNPDWQLQSCHIQFQVNHQQQIFRFDLTNNEWKVNGQPTPKLNGCTEVDISLSPFTNTLPVNRLQLATQQSAEIKVVYIDILNGTYNPMYQQYKKLTDTTYGYQNIPNNFEAVITVDKDGFVVDYPELFTCIAVQ